MILKIHLQIDMLMELMDVTADNDTHSSRTPFEPTLSSTEQPTPILGSLPASLTAVDTKSQISDAPSTEHPASVLGFLEPTLSLTEQPTPFLGSLPVRHLPAIDTKSQTPIDSTLFSTQKIEQLLGSSLVPHLSAIDTTIQTPVEHQSVLQTSLPPVVVDYQPPQATFSSCG